jgi:8-oxo-dGTP pyrophosphatase MutT (NUDIX family)
MNTKTDLTVGACIFLGNKVLLIHHAKLGLWLFPGGHIEKDEIPDDTVKREAFEETGLVVEVVQGRGDRASGELRVLAQPFYVNLHSVGDHQHVCFYYICTARHSDISINSESKAYRWMSSEEIQADLGITAGC